VSSTSFWPDAPRRKQLVADAALTGQLQVGRLGQVGKPIAIGDRWCILSADDFWADCQVQQARVACRGGIAFIRQRMFVTGFGLSVIEFKNQHTGRLCQ
jgi:hypothetical protein